MKNVTVALDDDIHHRARIRAAELGTSLSALVKEYLTGLVAGEDGPSRTGVREMPMPFKSAPIVAAPLPPRMLGAMKGEIWMADDFDVWPDDILDALDGGIGAGADPLPS